MASASKFSNPFPSLYEAENELTKDDYDHYKGDVFRCVLHVEHGIDGPQEVNQPSENFQRPDESVLKETVSILALANAYCVQSRHAFYLNEP